MSRKKKIITVLAGLVLLGIVGAALIPSPVPVSAVRVEKGYFAEYVEDEGYTWLRFTYAIAAPVQGYLHRVDLEAGDKVMAGDVLFSMEPLPAPGLDLRALRQAGESLEAAGARLEAARAEHEGRLNELEYARREADRHAELFEREIIPISVLDRVQRDLNIAQAAERAAHSAVEAAWYEKENARAVVETAQGARLGLKQKLEIRSPVQGVILRRQRYQEGSVPAGTGILEIGNLDELEVRVDLLTVDAIRVRPGMRVMFMRWGGEKEIFGRVRLVEPAGFREISALGVDEQRVAVLVEIVSPREDWAHLGKEYRVEARFILWEEDDVMHIPTSALFRENHVWKVFVVEDGRAVIREVETGRRSGLRTKIISGLEPGETVIIHPGERVTENIRVDVQLD